MAVGRRHDLGFVKMRCLATVAALVALALLGGIALLAPAAAHADCGSVFSGVLEDNVGSPVTGASVQLQAGGVTVANTQTGTDGSFSLTVAPGVYGVEISGQASTGEFAGLNYAFMATVDLTDSLVGQTLVMPATVPLRVAVQDASGNPVGGATVTYLDADGDVAQLGGSPLRRCSAGSRCPARPMQWSRSRVHQRPTSLAMRP